MGLKHEYRIVYQRKSKTQKIAKYATKERAVRRCEKLSADPQMLYVRLQQRAVGEWAKATA